MAAGALKRVKLYTDGSVLSNPGPGGWAWLYFGPGVERKYGSGSARILTTNNRMELLAACRGLEACREAGFGNKILLHSDSQYVVNGVNRWADGWIRNGWRTRAGGSVSNESLWRRLVELKYELNAEFCWVRGHVGTPGNEFVDRLAGAASWRAREMLKEADASF